MAAIKEIYIVCDIQGPGCQKSFGFGNQERTAKEQRFDAGMNGWHFVNGEDICPECYGDRKQGYKDGKHFTHKDFKKKQDCI